MRAPSPQLASILRRRPGQLALAAALLGMGAFSTGVLRDSPAEGALPVSADVAMLSVPLGPGSGAAAGAPPDGSFHPSVTDPEVDYGYVGPFVLHSTTGRTQVLTDTVFVLPGTSWTANGLVRNETGSPISGVTVTATLKGAGGAVLGTVSGASLLNSLRPGEPAPFQLASDIPQSLVSSVTYLVNSTGSEVRNRDLTLSTYYFQSYGQRESRREYPLFDPPTAPYPFAAFGEIVNTGGADTSGLRAIGAWLDPQGRVLHVASLVDVTSGGPLGITKAGGQIDWIYKTTDSTTAARIHDRQFIMWGESK